MNNSISVRDLRSEIGLSQDKFAKVLGVSVSSLRRWESGDATPSSLAMRRIVAITDMPPEEVINELRMKDDTQNTPVLDIFRTFFSWKGKKYNAEWMPFVINGPSDQRAFYDKLIQMQERSIAGIPEYTFFHRLSMLKSVDGIVTAQYEMEKPKLTARSWSSDYGTHGFHRYVGRFPSHLIRALINAFGATNNDSILDPFCGSGTTLVEARMLGVKATGIEISPLSAMMSRVKSQFPAEPICVSELITAMTSFYHAHWNSFGGNALGNKEYDDILRRKGNSIPCFSNIERWFTKEALLGASIIVEYILAQEGYVKELLTIALSAKMRSIGNVDVDVVRAEYRKHPRENVDVLKLVTSQLQKMVHGINDTVSACNDTIGEPNSINVLQTSVLSADIPAGSISHIITSPPYGVESLSYLRTHLLSFRALEPILGVDPYNFGDGVIGSEYLSDETPKVNEFAVNKASYTYAIFFEHLLDSANSQSDIKRITMMMKFFEDMYNVIERFSIWLKPKGKVAFIIGNKKIGDKIIPTDTIISELFAHFGFSFDESIGHKLKTNNSNSQVPWQDRIIENEFVMLFTKEKV